MRWLIALAVATSALPAAAQGRIAVVSQDEQLAASLEHALAPWGATVITLDSGSAPGASMPGSADRGLAIARASHADAVVWLSHSEDGWAVWVYDAEDQRAMARSLASGPPFDEPTAAAIVLTIMTLLRHSHAAPPRERVRPPAPPLARELRIELAGGAEAFSTSPDQVEPRFALAAGFWPRDLGGSFGVELAVRGGTGIGVSGGALAARFFDTRAILRAHARGRVIGPLWLGALVGVGARIALLDGTLTMNGAVDVVRAAGVLEAEGEIAIDLDPLLVALRVGAGATAWALEYDVEGQPELTTQFVWPMLELCAELGF